MSLLLCLCVATVLLPVAHGYKCDQTVINKINKLWGKSVPDNMLETSLANGKEVVVATSKGYYPSDTKCLFSLFNTDSSSQVSFTGYRYLKDGTTPTPKSAQLTEENGKVIEPDSGIIRYHVFTKCGVAAFYKCDKSDKQGPAEGLIKVRSCSHNQKDVDQAKQVLQSIGVTIGDLYPDKCGPVDKCPKKIYKC